MFAVPEAQQADDGIDPDSSVNSYIFNCTFSNDDDCSDDNLLNGDDCHVTLQKSFPFSLATPAAIN